MSAKKAAKTAPAKAKKVAVDSVRLKLFAPGMTPMHRAGLGGLACVLHALENDFHDGRLKPQQLPGHWKDGCPPWSVSETEIELRFGQPEQARPFLQSLFEHAFAIRSNGLIDLPGCFPSPPTAAALADQQQGFMLTFLQHGKVRVVDDDPTHVHYDSTDGQVAGIDVEYRACRSFTRQKGWEKFVDSHGCFQEKSARVDGPLFPGAVVRHVAFNSHTAVEEPAERVLCLYFAMLGTLSLAVNRGVGILVIPEVTNLLDFIQTRPLMSPTDALGWRVANAADAALQSLVRLRMRHLRDAGLVPGCTAITLQSTPWASQQKSRVAALEVDSHDPKQLERFEIALQLLPPRVVTTGGESPVPAGKRKTKKAESPPRTFRADSVVRPLVAENLALGRPWYRDFARLMYRKNPANDKPYRETVVHERKGLFAMISENAMWERTGDQLVVKAVHEAMRLSMGRIRHDTDGAGSKPLSQATKNRWERFREKLRLDLCGAKTAAHVRFVLTDLFSRGGSNAVLRESWQQVLPVLQHDWQLARDLGLLALASYVGRGEVDSVDSSNS
jgi:CRISPR-associated protein Cas8a1/Csx13